MTTDFCGTIAAQAEPVIVHPGIFAHQHGVGPVRQDCASGNLGRLSGRDLTLEGMASARFPNDGPRAGQVCETNGKAVHRAVVGGRLIALGMKRCGQIAAGGPRNFQRFTAEWMAECENAPLRLLNRQHQAARQSPDRPPDLARRRTPSIVMPLSMAFTMS